MCKLRANYAGGGFEFGTGWTSSPNAIVTAAHCLHAKENRATSVDIWVGRREGMCFEEYHFVLDTQNLFMDNWGLGEHEDWDIAVIRLPHPLPSNLSFLGCNHGLPLSEATLIGYPAEAEHSMNIGVSPTPAGNGGRIRHNGSTMVGMSGSPLVVPHAGHFCVIGMHTHGLTHAAQGLRLDATRASWIDSKS